MREDSLNGGEVQSETDDESDVNRLGLLIDVERLLKCIYYSYL